MAASQSVQLYQILQEHFGKSENAAKAVSAIEAIIDDKITNKSSVLESSLGKNLDLMRSDIVGTLRTEIREQKADILKATYMVGIVQFLAIAGIIAGLIKFMLK